MPTQRLTVNILDQVIEEIILVLFFRIGTGRRERLLGLQKPADWSGYASGVQKLKCTQAIERAIGKPRSDGLPLENLRDLHGFGMSRQKGLHGVWIRLARLGVGL